jgi:heme/copper-type cytochrome/quinol oxidase subunit 2
MMMLSSPASAAATTRQQAHKHQLDILHPAVTMLIVQRAEMTHHLHHLLLILIIIIVVIVIVIGVAVGLPIIVLAKRSHQLGA